MARRPPRDTRYRQGVVTFIDILGFRELVGSRSATEILRSIETLRSFGNAGTARLVPGERAETRAVNFSDSIVRVRYFDFEDGDGQGAVFYEALNLVHAQADLVNQGLFVRGGMTVGSIYVRRDNAFGPAFVRAYELENGFANFPRIVLGPEVFTNMRSDPRLSEDVSHDVHYLRRVLRQGDDGLWFIDYLKAIRTEMDNPELYPEVLMNHRSSIIERASRATTLRTLQKYLWLSTYHNKICRETNQIDDLLIDSHDVPSLELLDDIAAGINDDFD